MHAHTHVCADASASMIPSIDRLPHRAAIAGIICALLWIPFVPTRVAAVFFATGVLPGLAVVSRARFSLDAALGIGAALSPVIFGVLMLLAMFAGASVHGAAIVASAVGLVLFVGCAGRTGPLDAENRRSLVGASIVLLVASVLALSLPLAETWWRVREDSWFHAAVADKLARDGLPLTDPYFAGLRIQYMYAYHAIIAACASLAGIDLFRAMILVNAIALTSSVGAFHALTGQFSRRFGPRVLATCLCVFGMNGWFYLWYPVQLARAVLGETQGLETLRRVFPWTPPGHATAMSLLSVEGNQFMFLDKFMIGTALSLTFGLVASLLLLLVRARRGDWSHRHDLAFFLCIAGATLLHLVTGLTIALVTAAVLALLLLVRAQPSPCGPSYARLVSWIACALVATTPYIVSVMPQEAGAASLEFALQQSQAIGLLFAVAPALVFAWLFLRGKSRDTNEALGSWPFGEMSLSATGIVLLWASLVAVAALTVDLVTNNETKFAFLLLLPLAALATGAFEQAWETPRKRALAIAVVVSATLPLHALYFHHAVRDASTFDVSDSERAVYDWIAKRAPADAVIIEDHDNVRIPVLASRDVFFGTEGYARNWGYPMEEMIARKRIRDAVFSEAGPSEVDMLRLRALDRPVLVVYRLDPNDMIDAPERFQDDKRFRGRFATREIAVWELFANE